MPTVARVPPRVVITLFEPSADANAAALVRALRARHIDIEVDALAGPQTRAAGGRLLDDTVAGAAMGLRGLLRANRVRGWLRDLDADYAARPPALHVCVDSWTANANFARLAKRHRVPVLYYVAPQAWASREGRARELAEVADRVACILPFEETWFRARGVAGATFVGHPLFDRVAPAPPTPARDVGDAPLVGLPCGSRRSVAAANLPRQLLVAGLVRAEFPRARFLVPVVENTRAVVGELTRGRADVEPGAFDDLMPRCDIALTTSGTATLHLAAHGVPMAVVYAGSPVLWHAVGRWVIRTRTFAMPNLLASGRRDVPAAEHVVREFIPWSGDVGPAAAHVVALLRDVEARQRMKDALWSRVVAPLARPGASERVADLAFELMRTSP